MSAELFDRRVAAPPAAPHLAPDSAFDACSRLTKLRAALTQAARRLRPSRWNEPTLFFFDRKRQEELASARLASSDRFADLSAMIAAEMPVLLGAVEVRRVARAVGLKDASLALAPHCPAAKELVDLLAVPDDEVFFALAPAARTGVRLHLRGAAEVAELYRLLTLTNNGPFQLFAPAAIRPDGTLPPGFAGSEHWLWPTQPLATVPRINGERVVLIGPAFVHLSLDVESRFPTLAVESEVVETLNAFQVTDALSRLCAGPLRVPPVAVPAVARAA